MFQKNRKRKISSEDLVFKDEEPQRKSARQQRNEEKKAAEKRAAEAAAAAKSNSGKRTVANLSACTISRKKVPNYVHRWS